MLLQVLFPEHLLVYSGYSLYLQKHGIVDLVSIVEKEGNGKAVLAIMQTLPLSATLLPAMPWPYIDVMLIAVPVSAIFTLVVSLLTKPPAQEVIDKAFENIGNKGSEVQ